MTSAKADSMRAPEEHDQVRRVPNVNCQRPPNFLSHIVERHFTSIQAGRSTDDIELLTPSLRPPMDT